MTHRGTKGETPREKSSLASTSTAGAECSASRKGDGQPRREGREDRLAGTPSQKFTAEAADDSGDLTEPGPGVTMT